MGFARHLRWVSMAVMTGSIASMAWATDGALLEVLRHNKLITNVQYEALKKAQAEKGKAVSDRPPAQDQNLLDVLLANGLISQAQYADLRVETAGEKKTDPEVTVSLKDGFKVTSQDGTFQAQPGTLFQFDRPSTMTTVPISRAVQSCAARGSPWVVPCSPTGITSSRRISLAPLKAAPRTT